MERKIVEDNLKSLIEQVDDFIRYSWLEYNDLDRQNKFSMDIMSEHYHKNRYVYFIRNKYNGLVKIGCTSDYVKRMRTLEYVFKNTIGMENAIEVIGIIDTMFIDSAKVEKFFHKKYEKYRKYGEWFEIPAEVMNKIQEEYLGFDSSEIQVISEVGHPDDEKFIELIYGRYNHFDVDDRKAREIAFNIINDIYSFDVKTFCNKDGFYNYLKQSYLKYLLDYIKENNLPNFLEILQTEI